MQIRCGSEIKTIISFPNWKGADFWPKLLQNRQTWKRDVQDAMLSYPTYRSENSQIFRGKVTRFGFVSIVLTGKTKRKKGLKVRF